MSAARRGVNLDTLAERCQALKLIHAAECMAELVEEASREDLSPVKFLDRVLEREVERKDERRIVTSLKLSGLPVGKTFEGFDWTFQPQADRSKIETLATCAFVRKTENVLFMGPPGVGKSHLAVALAVKAIKKRLQCDPLPSRRPDARAQGRRGHPAPKAQGQALLEQLTACH